MNDVTFEDNCVIATRYLDDTFANDNNQHATNPITKNQSPAGNMAWMLPYRVK